MEPKVEQIWKDNDPRMDGRLVRIIEISGGWVVYRNYPRGSRVSRSAAERFVKAFSYHG